MSDTATAPTAPKALKRCACAGYAGNVDGAVTTTECTAETTAKFAPGHDAKLKSLFMKTGAENGTITKTVMDEDGATSVKELTPIEAANEHGFGPQVTKGIEAARKKVEAKEAREAERQRKAEEREAAKAERKRIQEERQARARAEKEAKEAAANKLPEPGPAHAKVGRKVYSGEILADGLFRFEKDGEPVEVEKYTVVPAPTTSND